MKFSGAGVVSLAVGVSGQCNYACDLTGTGDHPTHWNAYPEVLQTSHLDKYLLDSNAFVDRPNSDDQVTSLGLVTSAGDAAGICCNTLRDVSQEHNYFVLRNFVGLTYNATVPTAGGFEFGCFSRPNGSQAKPPAPKGVRFRTDVEGIAVGLVGEPTCKANGVDLWFPGDVYEAGHPGEVRYFCSDLTFKADDKPKLPYYHLPALVPTTKEWKSHTQLASFDKCYDGDWMPWSYRSGPRLVQQQSYTGNVQVVGAVSRVGDAASLCCANYSSFVIRSIHNDNFYSSVVPIFAAEAFCYGESGPDTTQVAVGVEVRKCADELPCGVLDRSAYIFHHYLCSDIVFRPEHKVPRSSFFIQGHFVSGGAIETVASILGIGLTALIVLI